MDNCAEGWICISYVIYKKYLKMNHLKVKAQTLKCLDENIKHK